MKKENESIVTLSLTDARMLLLIDYIISNKINNIKTNKDFLLSIGFTSVNNYSYVLKGGHSFTIKQLVTACKIYNVNGDFFLNESCTTMFKEDKKISAYRMLVEAVHRVKVELNGRGN